MAEYIEREAAFEYNEQCKKCFLFQVCASVLKQQLFIREKMLAKENPKCSYYIPAADVVEVRHGEWVPSLHHYGLYMCSECQCSDEKCQPIFDKRNAWKKCPNCGAKMDGKGEE